MIYTDGIHLVADSLDELHSFALKIGLNRRYYEGVRKGHPHYDLTNSNIRNKVLGEDVLVVTSREILIRSKDMR